MYIFDTHYGTSTLTDDQTGLYVQWENGRFNETQKIKLDGSTIMTLIPEGEDPALYLAKKMQEMGDYIAKEYPELI